MSEMDFEQILKNGVRETAEEFGIEEQNIWKLLLLFIMKKVTEEGD